MDILTATHLLISVQIASREGKIRFSNLTLTFAKTLFSVLINTEEILFAIRLLIISLTVVIPLKSVLLKPHKL